MIKLLRIDERLVHGQVAVSWTKYLQVNRIIVADDEASLNETQKIAMQMAIPSGTKLSVVPLEKAISLLNDSRAAKLSIFVIVANPKMALGLLESVKDIPKVNFGNYGRMNESSIESKKKLASSFYCDDTDIEIINKILTYKIPVNYQTVPSEKEYDVSTLIKDRGN